MIKYMDEEIRETAQAKEIGSSRLAKAKSRNDQKGERKKRWKRRAD
jgi:hypothetical protein